MKLDNDNAIKTVMEHIHAFMEAEISSKKDIKTALDKLTPFERSIVEQLMDDYAKRKRIIGE